MGTSARIALVVALVAGAFWLGGRHSVIPEASSASAASEAPGNVPVVPQGSLSEWEKSNVRLFQQTAPSVAYITTEARRFDLFQGVQVVQGAGSGFV